MRYLFSKKCCSTSFNLDEDSKKLNDRRSSRGWSGSRLHLPTDSIEESNAIDYHIDDQLKSTIFPVNTEDVIKRNKNKKLNSNNY